MNLRKLDRSKEDKFKDLLKVFEGTPAEATLLEMAQELGPERAFDLMSLVIARVDQIAEIWKDVTGQ